MPWSLPGILSLDEVRLGCLASNGGEIFILEDRVLRRDNRELLLLRLLLLLLSHDIHLNYNKSLS
jgi:hypothetical protein